MVQRQITRLFLSGLILLLGIQLTGLSCLGDWQALMPLPDRPVQYQVDRGSPGDAGLVDDGCPCHLALMSGPGSAYEVSAPPALLDLGAPVTNPSAHTFLLFRPPLSL